MSGEPHPNFKFDYAAAQQVIDDAKKLMSITKNQVAQRNRKASNMRSNWKGHYADEFFDNELPRMRSQAASLVTELQALIQQVDNAINTAHDFANQNQKWQEQNQPTPIPLGPGEI